MKAPCIDCPERGCGAYHDQCKIYKQYKAEAEKLQLKRIKHFEVYGIESVAREKLRDGSKKSDTEGAERK